METIRFDNLTFTYPLADRPALSNVSFEVHESEFFVICGKSGCGKTTLLRQMKKNLIPYGELFGEVLYYGEPIESLDDRLSATQIGFVQQNPDNQIVTDKVWHELAFGLENLGLKNEVIRRRVAEMASYFDIQSWFRRDVSNLSGGQKQLLNLASIMVMQPKLLVLDEPTSQLDPIAASEFLRAIHKINRELGVTIILSEHRLEEAFAMADRVMVMDRGSVLTCDSPRIIGGSLYRQDHPMFFGLPTVNRIYHSVVQEEDPEQDKSSPLTVREGRLWMREYLSTSKDFGVYPKTPSAKEAVSGEGTPAEISTTEEEGHGKPPTTEKENRSENPVIEVKDLWFRYNKKDPDVLRDMNLKVYKGELYCLLGGNGTGKTTAMKILQGIISPQRGKVTTTGRTAMLPQNPQALFSEITAADDLLAALSESGKTDSEKVRSVEEMLKLLEIAHLHDVHPYDLSGGEQQRLALGKVLLTDPEIILLDEPTKGLDPFFKITLAEILHRFTLRGITILMVSHDIEFCAEFGDRCAMFFDGNIVSEGKATEFFAGNNFYTTTANRIGREYFPNAVTWKEVAECIRKAK